jgi:hypothetical protein
LNLPFSYEGFDELFKMKYVPQPYHYIKDLLQIRDEDDEVFRSFFTEEVPPPHVGYAGDDVRIRYFGHACLLIESKETSILCDPALPEKSKSHPRQWVDLFNSYLPNRQVSAFKSHQRELVDSSSTA